MKLSSWVAAGLLIAIVAPTPSQACGGHRGRGCGLHHRAVAVACAQPAPAMMSYATPQTMTYATPQGTTAMAAAPAPEALAADPAAAQPTYDYAAAPNGQPAYYYTYDSSGKLIVAQWMDWVFRGGRAAGEPAPPLPIIGALRNR